MRERRGRQRLHVVREHEIAPFADRASLRASGERDRGPLRRAERDLGRGAGRVDERHHVVDHGLVNVDLAHGPLARYDIVGPQHRLQIFDRVPDELTPHDLGGACPLRVADRDRQGESVELSLGQRIGAVLLDRFSVAITTNRAGSGWVRLPVTCRSSIGPTTPTACGVVG
jgi:hypothetical protein